MYSPEMTRIGANSRFDGEHERPHPGLCMFNFAETKTFSSGSRSFAQHDGFGTTDSTLLLPVYTCASGVGNANPTATGCNASNGVLNKNNPYASSGQVALLSGAYDQPTETYTDAKTYRFSGGISGDFGKGWNFNVEGTTSWINLDVTQKNYINAQHLLDRSPRVATTSVTRARTPRPRATIWRPRAHDGPFEAEHDPGHDQP
jgi:iron complex outermembrane receptor protein